MQGLCLLVALCVFISARGGWVVEPSPPILGIPFRVTTTVSVASIFISPSPSCNVAANGGAPALISNGAAIFQLVATNQSIFYVCNSQTFVSLTQLTFDILSFSPLFALRTLNTIVTFPAFTPNGTASLRDYSDCSGGSSATQALSSTKQIQISLSSSGFYFLCLTFADSVTARDLTVNIGQFVVTDTSSFTPHVVVTNQIANFQISGAAPPTANVFVSSSSRCETIAQGPFQGQGTFGKTVTFVVNLPRGIYSMCIEVPLNSGVYIPATGTLVIQQYSVTPSSLIAGLVTTFNAFLDSDLTSGVIALASSRNCVSPFVVASTLVNGQTNLTLGTPGTYYSCVFNAGTQTYIFASSHTVIPLPSFTLEPSILVRSLPVTVTSLAVSLSLGSPTNPIAVFNSSVRISLVPSDAPDTIELWASSPDLSYWYQYPSVAVRTLQLQHDAAFVQEQFALSTVPVLPINSFFRFASTLGCRDGDIFASSVSKISIGQSGTNVFCVNASVFGFQPIVSDVVFSLPVVTPSAALAGRIQTVQITGIPIGVNGSIGFSCNAPIVSFVTQSQQQTLQTAFQTGSYVVCVTFPGTQQRNTIRDIANVTFFGVSHSPTVQVLNSIAVYSITTFDTSLLSNQLFGLASDCSRVDSAVPISLKGGKFIATLPVTVSGSLFACVGNGSLGFVSAGVTRIVDGFSVSQTLALAQLPFNVTVMNSVFQPSIFAVTQNSCDNATSFIIQKTLLFGASQVVLSSPGEFVVCVAADDNTTFLSAGKILVGTFSSLTTTIVRLQDSNVSVSSQLVGSNLLLSTSSNCSGTQYAIHPTSAVNGWYNLCQGFGGRFAAATNRILVIDPFVVAAPMSVRSFIPFVVNISQGDVAQRATFSVFLSLGTCDDTPSVSFSSSSPSLTIMIPTMQFVNSILCTRTLDGQVTQMLTTFSPLPYMTPYTLPSTVPVRVKSGFLSNGFGIIAPDSSCLFSWMVPQQIVAGNGVYVIPFSSQSSGVYCESVDGVVFTAKSLVSIIHFTDASGAQLIIANQTVYAGQPVPYGVNLSAVSSPFFSTTTSCARDVDLSHGYLPRENEVALFYVCVSTVDRTLTFTTSYPTVRVLGLSVFPTSLSGGVRTLTFSSVVPSGASVFVGDSSCSQILANGSQTSGAQVQFLIDSSLDGVYSICASYFASTVAISSVLIVKPYVEISRTLTLVEVPICFGLALAGSSYSLVNENQSTFQPYRQYYSSSNRSVFFSASDALCTIGAGLQVGVSVTNISRVCLSTTGLNVSIVTLCAGSPAGFLPTATVQLRKVSVSPQSIVAGGFTTVQFQNAPFSQFTLGNADCTTQISPLMATDGNGKASFQSLLPNGQFLQSAVYPVCLLTPLQSWVAIATVTVTPSQQYSVSNNMVVATVPSEVDLLEDLTADRIIGLSSTSQCNDVAPDVSLQIRNSTRILLIATAPGTRFLCARTPVNNSVVVVSAVTITAPFAQFARQVSSCTSITIGLQGASFIGATISLVNSTACCTAYSSTTVTVANIQTPSVRTLTVTDIYLERFTPSLSFAVCATSATQCYDIGTMDFVTSACSLTPAPTTPSPDNLQVNGSSNLRQDLVNGAQHEQKKDISTTIILAVVFGALLIVGCVVLLVYCCIRSRRIIPVDEGPAPERGETDTWKRTFDSIVTNKRNSLATQTLNAMLHVPISMKLDTCREAPIPIQRLELAERDSRAILEQVERETFFQLTSYLLRELEEARMYGTLMEKSRIVQQVAQMLQSECMVVIEEEEVYRLQLVDEEERIRLTLLDYEKQNWRRQMDLEGQRLKAALERDPFWKSRRKLLHEASQRAMQSVQASPAQYDPTPSRTLMVDPSVLESRYADKELWY